MKTRDIRTQLDRIADRQTDVFLAYSEAGIYKAAQADPTSAITAIDIEMQAYHLNFAILLNGDLGNPMARDYAERYIETMTELLDQAEHELTARDWSK